MSTLKVNILDTPSGAGNITLNRPIVGSGTLPAANLTGNLPAISGALLTNLPATGGDKRNFIIDGDFTQFPEGDKTSIANVNYTSALFKYVKQGGEIVFDSKQTVDAPTVAQSSHTSKYCLHMDVTTAESAVAAGDFAKVDYFITGSDFAFIHQQEITISFWHKHTKTGIYGVSLINGGGGWNRSYVFEYTQTTTNTWERVTKTITLDSSGTWPLTEADIGLVITFCIFSGTTYHGTADTWQAGEKQTTSNQVTGGDSASNNFKLSQVGLYLGSSAPTFLGESVATVKHQVEYYVTQLDGDNLIISAGFAVGTAQVRTALLWMEKRKIPTITVGATMVQVHYGGGASATSTSVSAVDIGKTGCRFTPAVSGTPFTLNAGVLVRINAVAGNRVLIDARH